MLAFMTPKSSSYATLTREISGQLAALRGDLPDVMKGFGDLSKASMASGALSEKTKELIALALAVAAHCPGQARRDQSGGRGSPGGRRLHGRWPVADVQRECHDGIRRVREGVGGQHLGK